MPVHVGTLQVRTEHTSIFTADLPYWMAAIEHGHAISKVGVVDARWHGMCVYSYSLVSIAMPCTHSLTHPI
jgi:hypothetical protein